MMSSNSRQTRTAGNTDSTVIELGDAKRPKTFMDRWVEPPLRPPAPSFMEYPHLDIVRHGVLENMAPLGTMPSSKVKKLAKTDGSRRLRLVSKGEASLSAASTPREAATPEPQPESKPESHVAEDAEWNPSTPVAQISARSAALEGMGVSSLQTSPSSMSASPLKVPTQEELELERTDRIIEIACREARATGHYHTGFALGTFYRDHRTNPRIRKVLNAVAAHTANFNQNMEFKEAMEWKKREGRTTGLTARWLAQWDKAHSQNDISFADVNFNAAPKKAAGEAANDAVSKSPHRDAEGHVHKKHKGNNYEATKQNGVHGVNENEKADENGDGNENHGLHSRTRSNSVLSSDSDLSSLDEELLAAHRESFASSPNQKQAATATADKSHPPTRNNQLQPITHQQKLRGPKLHAWDTASSNSAAPSIFPSHQTNNLPLSSSSTNPNKNPSDMPARLSESSIQQSSDSHPVQISSHPPPQPSLKFLKKAAGNVTRESEDTDRTLRLKRRAKEITENRARVSESFDRYHAESEAETGDPTAVARQPVKSGQVLRFRSSQASKRINDESDDLSSPTLPSFLADGAPGSSSNSRAGTPGTQNRTTRKPKSGLRMKTSPMKKKAGPSAGIPRASGERNSPIGSGGNQDDNDDYCSSCGGNGDLVCCDGCTRSFHFRCVDPPLSETQLPDNWFCNACNALRNPKPNEDYSVFGQLLDILQKKNPSAFHLPKDVREYFEGVRTGAEGEYEEGPVQKPKRNTGYEEAPDYLKLKDSKGNFILCHECCKGAGSSNPIIPCSFCGLHWHLDCLDPPLANPPPPGKMWRCPCHVDDLLAKVPGTLGPAHRFRKIKGASVVRPAFSRGVKNDGYIEIEFAPSDDEDEGFFDQKEYGKVYKLPEEGIKLDFISRIKSQVNAMAIPTPPPEITGSPSQPRLTAADRHSLTEQQAALNLAQFAAQTDTSDLTQTLIDALIAEAPPLALQMVAKGDASRISNRLFGQKEKESLLAMKALIEESLRSMDEMETVRLVKEEPTTKQEPKDDDDVDMLL